MIKKNLLIKIISCFLVMFLLSTVVLTPSFTQEKSTLPKYILGLEEYQEEVPVLWKYTTSSGYTETQRVSSHYFRGAPADNPSKRDIVAYCMDWGVRGPSNTLYDHKTTDVSEEKINQLTSVIMNGYPYVKSYTVKNRYNVNRYGRSATFTDDGGQGTFVLQNATQIAVWLVMGKDSRGRKMTPDGWVKNNNCQNLDRDIMEIAFDLYENAISDIDWLSTNIKSTNVSKFDINTSSKIYGPFVASSSFDNKNSSNKVSLSLSTNAPNGTKIINSSKQQISSVNLNENFYISVPASATATFNVSLSRDNGMILPLSYEAQEEDRQRMFFSTLSAAVTNLTIQHKQGNAGIKVIKTSSDGIIEGVNFDFYYQKNLNDAKTYLGTYGTDSSGEIFIEDLSIGYYTICEQFDDTKYEVYINGKLSEHGGGTIEVSNNDIGYCQIVNFENKRLNTTKIKLKKIDEVSQMPLENVGFLLYKVDVNGGNDTLGSPIGGGVTNFNGDLIFWDNLTDKKLTDKHFAIEPKYTNGKLLEENNTYAIVEAKGLDGYNWKAADGSFIKNIFKIDESNVNHIINLMNNKNSAFTNRPFINALKISKTDSKTNKPLANANFALYEYNPDNNEYIFIDTLVTNSNGIATYGLTEDGKIDLNIKTPLVYGKDYYIQETVAPMGYTLDSSYIKVPNITKDLETINLSITNNASDGSFELFKTDSTGQNALSDTSFKLYKVNQDYMKDFDEYIRSRKDMIETSISSSKTNTYYSYSLPNNEIINLEHAQNWLEFVKEYTTNSSGKIFDTLEYGEYIILETQAKYGYKKVNTLYRFAISESNMKYYIECINDPIQGKVKLTKIDSVSGKYIKGVEFILMQKGDASLQKPDIQYGNKTYTTDEQGVIEIENLGVGSYYFLEIKAPSNYEKPEDSDTKEKTAFSIDESHQYAEITYANKEKKSELTIHKTDNLSQKPIEGVVFALLNSDGTTYKTATTDIDGYAKFYDISIGTYKLTEISTAEGYDINSFTPIQVTIDENPQTIEVGNSKITADIKIIKVDSDTGNTLEGVEFTLYHSTDESNAVRTLLTDENGIALFEDIEYGSYIIVETKSLNGYKVSKSKTYVNITEDKEYVYTVANELIKRTIKLIKTDKDTKIPLANVEFDVYALVNGEYIKYTTVVTDENGECTFVLPFGEYELRETKTQKGYKISNDTTKIDLTLEDIEDILEIEITNEKIKNKIILLKSGDTIGNYIGGATYGLYDLSTDKLIAKGTSDKDGKIDFGYVFYGSYYIKEISAPDGYDISNDKILLTVDENSDEVQTFNAIDVKIPQTGINSRNVLLISISALFTALTFICYIVGKKMKKKSEL